MLQRAQSELRGNNTKLKAKVSLHLCGLLMALLGSHFHKALVFIHESLSEIKQLETITSTREVTTVTTSTTSVTEDFFTPEPTEDPR